MAWRGSCSQVYDTGKHGTGSASASIEDTVTAAVRQADDTGDALGEKRRPEDESVGKLVLSEEEVPLGSAFLIERRHINSQAVHVFQA